MKERIEQLLEEFDFDIEGFIQYLKHMRGDLIQSGHESTAEDYLIMIQIMSLIEDE